MKTAVKTARAKNNREAKTNVRQEMDRIVRVINYIQYNPTEPAMRIFTLLSSVRTLAQALKQMANNRRR